MRQVAGMTIDEPDAAIVKSDVSSVLTLSNHKAVKCGDKLMG